MNLLIVGTGYVGLVTGACFAEMGHHVTCLDIDKGKIDSLQQGIIPFYEPGLEELVLRNMKSGRLTFTTNYEEGVSSAKVCFLAVPTPARDDGSCNLSYMLQAARQIAFAMNDYKIIVNKSTVPVGSARKVADEIQSILKQKKSNLSFDVVSNPEFLKEGAAVSDCLKPDRIVLGIDNPDVVAVMKEIYSSFTINHDRIFIMDTVSSEMTKYAANAMLATRISFMNELSLLCEKVGANINQVRTGIGSDMRIGPYFLYAGIGYGGSCFPKDLKALQATAEENNCEMKILQAVEEVNETQKKILVQKMKSYFDTKGSINGKTIAIWGLSFKPDTDDMREAPSIEIIKELQALGATLRVFDPISFSTAQKAVPNPSSIIWCKDEYETVKQADAIALVTEWKQFRFVDFEKVKQEMNGKAFFDGRNQYKPSDMKAKGFDYFCIGIPTPSFDTSSKTTSCLKPQLI